MGCQSQKVFLGTAVRCICISPTLYFLFLKKFPLPLDLFPVAYLLFPSQDAILFVCLIYRRYGPYKFLSLQKSMKINKIVMLPKKKKKKKKILNLPKKKKKKKKKS